eukprot:gene22094-28193_t
MPNGRHNWNLCLANLHGMSEWPSLISGSIRLCDLRLLNCWVGKVLRETDYYGNKLTAKVCETCPTRQMVITADTTIAGATYKASAYKCQSCPDPHMTMSISNGVYVCTCDTGYTLCGVSSIGNQSCALDGLVSGYKRIESSALAITYHSNSAVGTLTSLTMQHYFTLAASRCKYFGGPQDLQYCQILANLCALQLFDDQTQACIAHQAVIADRGQNLQNSIENWVTGQPWLYYSSPADACADDNYAARITLKNLQLKYVVARYTMNGTFVDYSNIETLFTYCGVSSPNTGDGGGTSSSTQYQPAKISSASKDLKNKAGAVSVWRTIMVANEWAELQSLRLNLQYNATPQPILADKSAGELNIILRFANTTFFWMVFSLGQYLWKFLIYERFISEPPERLFVDFCTIAKVSVIILDEKYHGYYLHCRSPHQYADGTMVELVEMLHKEEAGLTVDRSLEGAPADVQTFQIYLTGEWRANFDKIYASLSRPVTITEILQQGRSKGVGRGGAPGASPAQMPRGGGMGLQLGGILNNIPPERVMKAWRELTIFLQEFVENNFGKAGLRRIVREPTYYEKLTGAGPDLSMQDQPSIFYTDRDFNYCKVLFLGRESELLLLDILAYSLFDLWFNSTATSMALTYLLDLGLCTARQWWGQAMISKKTMIDGRFLI